jgi:hypothetical protein
MFWNLADRANTLKRRSEIIIAVLQFKKISKIIIFLQTAEVGLDGDGEAHLIALACSKSPEGTSRWTLRLLSNRMVALEYVDNLSYETVRQVLKKTNLSLG